MYILHWSSNWVENITPKQEGPYTTHGFLDNSVFNLEYFFRSRRFMTLLFRITNWSWPETSSFLVIHGNMVYYWPVPGNTVQFFENLCCHSIISQKSWKKSPGIF